MKPRSEFRIDAAKEYERLLNEREGLQALHFELLKLFARDNKAAAIFHELLERDAGVISSLSRAKYLELKAALELIEQIQPALKAGKGKDKS